MNIDSFFDFTSKFVSTTVTASPLGLRFRSSSDSPGDALKLLTGDYTNISFPVVFKHDSGQQFRDFLDTGYAALFLISENLRSGFEKNNLTGWKSFPIKLLGKNGIEIGGYHGFSVTGRCGSIDFSKSKIIEKRYLTSRPVS